MGNVTKIIYQNSSDDSFALRIEFEKINDVIKEINNYVEDYAKDFTEWLLEKYIRNGDEDYYTDVYGIDTEIYDIDALMEKFKKLNNIKH